MDDVKSCNSLGIIFTAICLMLMAENFTVATALGGCGASCTSNNDCEGKLACINGVCNDDPTVGTDICGNDNSTQSSNSSSSCEPSGYLQGTSHSCNQGGYSDCCQAGQSYPQYECSPPITEATAAILTVNCFEQGGCGGGPSACDNHYHSDQDLIVALSTGWYAGGNRCFSGVTIYGNGQSVTAQVVDECDSVHGCDAEHDYQPPCGDGDVDASPAVWQALGVTKGDSRYGYMNVTWALA